MTLTEMLGQIDKLNPNDMDAEQKRAWILQLEKQICDETLDTHELGAEEAEKRAYIGAAEGLADDYELLVPTQYAEVYRRYVDAQIAMAACDTDAYENAYTLHNNALLTYKNYFNRTHRPLKTGRWLL